MPTPLIFTLNRISQADTPALQSALRAAPPLLQPPFMQQRPRSIGGLLAPTVPVNRPWSTVSGQFGIVDVPSSMPNVVHQFLPYPPTQFGFVGITRDSTGGALGGCTVKLYRERDDFAVETTVSDANGNYRLTTASTIETYYVRWYLAGSPDRAGTSKNTLSPA